ncbi:MAG: Alpha-galactosidase, partial [Frondihabitans sp.]|nr:Alpha-galactosidase [Frondihabitans sp.]
MSETLVLSDTLQWGHDALQLSFSLTTGQPPRLSEISARGTSPISIPTGLPLMDVLLVSAGHALASGRLVHTRVGESLRFAGHEATEDESGVQLVIVADDIERDLRLRMKLSSPWGVPVFTSRVEIENVSNATTVILQSVTSWSSYAGHSPTTDSDPAKWSLTRGYSDWLAEGRWMVEPLDSLRMPDEASWLTGHNSRGARAFASEGTWSTGKHIPVAVLSSEVDAFAWAWQIEHNGGWRFEIGRDIDDAYFALGGPTDIDHQWTHTLAPGDTFESVPVAIALGTDMTTAVAALTTYRRVVRRPSADNTNLPIVFNDYMNTLNGDPTTEKLEPLIDAAADIGADIFCIDAGWYDDTSDWWDSVGLWEPSTTRFRDGLGAITNRIRDRGMIPGLWLEPEVVGVKSLVADRLPTEAFFSRHGERVVEQGRYHLDLR